MQSTLKRRHSGVATGARKDVQVGSKQRHLHGGHGAGGQHQDQACILPANGATMADAPALLIEHAQVVEGNPCISYVEMVIFAWFGKFEVKRNADNGGDRCAVVLVLRWVCMSTLQCVHHV